MQKFKYIIILVLVLVLALVYLQLDDYDNISHSLLEDNIKSQKRIEKLQEKITTLENKNVNLQEDLVFLHNKVENLNLELEALELRNTKQNLQDDTAKEIQKEIFEQQLEDHIMTNKPIEVKDFTLENENSITGFGQTNE